MAGDDVGGLGRPSQRAVVDRRERHSVEPSAQSRRLLASAWRKNSVRGVAGFRVLFAMADEVELGASHRRTLQFSTKMVSGGPRGTIFVENPRSAGG
jgi:hypothetical protein